MNYVEAMIGDVVDDLDDAIGVLEVACEDEKALDAMSDAIERAHASFAQLIPVSSGDSINVQMERAGFLNGEVVVILRESDYLVMKECTDFIAHDEYGSPLGIQEQARKVLK